jgi:hypothetical protein
LPSDPAARQDDDVDAPDLDRAERELVSLLHQCETVLENSSSSASRTTLMTNRVPALRVAVDLVREAREAERAPRE